MTRQQRSLLITFIVLFAIILFDQYTKYLIKSSMNIGQSIKILGNFIRFTYVENTGIAFGIHLNNTYVFTGLSLLASTILAVYLYKNREEHIFLKVSLAMILGGAFGNLIDRIFFGKVVDFLDIGIGGLRWWIFNVADSAVVVGMFFLIIYLYRCDKCIKNE